MRSPFPKEIRDALRVSNEVKPGRKDNASVTNDSNVF